MSEIPHSKSNQRGRQRKRTNLWIVGGVLTVLAAVFALAARDVWTANEAAPIPVAEPQAAIDPPTQVEPLANVESNVVDDDGASLWVSPTDGPPLDLAYLPPGVELVLALRPQSILSNSEGEKIVASLGPHGAAAIAEIERSIGMSLQEVERLLVGWQVGRDGAYLPTFVVTTGRPIQPPANSFQPDAEKGRVTILAPPSARIDIQEMNGEPPPFGRDVERLLRCTDDNRSATLLAPRSLLREDNPPLRGELAPLRSALEAAIGPDTAAFAVSLDWGNEFFAELLAVPTLESSPIRLSDQLAEQVQAWPRYVEQSILELNTSPYGRRVVARLPEMMRRVAAYARHGANQDCAMLRCYLPVAAGHNLLMASELALAEGEGATDAAGQASMKVVPAASITEKMRSKTTLRFGREELEAALNMLAEDVGVTITIRGRDLQLDGITRNQLFAIDLADRPAEEILVEILRRANPDKTATGPADPRQKLVYVVGAGSIIITTRSQAASRGEELPAVFRGE